MLTGCSVVLPIREMFEHKPSLDGQQILSLLADIICSYEMTNILIKTLVLGEDKRRQDYFGSSTNYVSYLEGG